MEELRNTLRKPALAERFRPHHAGHMVNELKAMAAMIDPLPRVVRSPDPEDDFLLETAEGGRADYLVTGAKSSLLTLVRHEGTRIVTAASFAHQFV